MKYFLTLFVALLSFTAHAEGVSEPSRVLLAVCNIKSRLDVERQCYRRGLAALLSSLEERIDEGVATDLTRDRYHSVRDLLNREATFSNIEATQLYRHFLNKF